MPASGRAVAGRRGRARPGRRGRRRRHGLGGDLLDGLGGGGFGVRRGVAGAACSRRLRRPSAGGLRREAAGGRGRLGAAGAAAGPAAGADRDDLGVSHGRSSRAAASGSRSARPATARSETRDGRPASRRRSRRTPRRSCTPARTRARSRIRVVSMPRPKVRKLSCSGEKSASRAWRSTEPSWPTAKPGSGTVGALQPAERLRQHQDAVAGDVEGARDVGERRRAGAPRSRSSSWTNCMRAS